MHQAAHGEAPSSADPATTGFDAAVPRFLSEHHFTVKEVARMWKLAQSTVRELFAQEPCVRFGKPTRRVGGGPRRGYINVRIPQSSLLRLHRRLTGPGWYSKLATEPHYTAQDLAEAWKISDTKVRRMFADDNGVLRIGKESRRVGRKLTRRLYSMRVPQTVARRLYEALVTSHTRQNPHHASGDRPKPNDC